ncbi:MULTISPECIES: hypothetical protein [Rhizobium]|uniref:hypothetical protein n=1 Tax=Rhizobium TaxID=379 RepID=UPI0010304F6C|nr:MULTISPECIES: hypothetical protein [Rhizobium]MBA1343921.1 hypothetical protein [Rhizobium sp. WYCCWR 11146]TBF89180.1 hypothetical protein ELG82_37175 [Rhizobium leguminosarum]
MVLKAVIGTVAGIAGLIGILSAVPADMSQLRYIDRCVTQMMMPMPMGCGPYHIDITKADDVAKTDDQKSYEEALILLFLGGSSRGAQWTSLETPIDDIDRREVAFPADKIGGTLELVSAAPSKSTDEVEVAGILKWLIGIGIL